jgi:hypothetical protein
MDQELKQYLEAMESRMTDRLENRIDGMVTLLIDVKESLERQIDNLSRRFDAQASGWTGRRRCCKRARGGRTG